MQSARSRVLLSVIGILLIVSLSAALHNLYTVRAAGAVDFYIPWNSTRLYLFEGKQLYSDQLASEIQLDISGQTSDAVPGLYFYYPYYTIYFLAPFTLFPYDWVQALV